MKPNETTHHRQLPWFLQAVIVVLAVWACLWLVGAWQDAISNQTHRKKGARLVSRKDAACFEFLTYVVFPVGVGVWFFIKRKRPSS